MTDVSAPVRRLKTSSGKKKNYNRFHTFIKNIASQLDMEALKLKKLSSSELNIRGSDLIYNQDEEGKNSETMTHKLSDVAVNALNIIIYGILEMYKTQIAKSISFVKKKTVTINDKEIDYATELIFSPDSRSKVWDVKMITNLKNTVKYPMMREMKKAVMNYDSRSVSVGDKSSRQSKSDICALNLPVRRVYLWLKLSFDGRRVSEKASTALTAAIEFCIKDIIYLARVDIPDERVSKTIGDTDIYRAIKNHPIWNIVLGQYAI